MGQHLIEALTANDLDVTRTNALGGRLDAGIGHAFYYIYRRLMNNKTIPHVPVMANTYYPPNVPIATRCYRLGQAVRQVIEEELDSRILESVQNDDMAKLTDYPDVRFRAGTSEIKNWVTLAGTPVVDDHVDGAELLHRLLVHLVHLGLERDVYDPYQYVRVAFQLLAEIGIVVRHARRHPRQVRRDDPRPPP